MRKITQKDMLDLLDALRAAACAELAALGDGDEARIEQSPEAMVVRTINAITERINEMTAVEFFDACEEFCAGRRCKDCPINVSFCPAHGTRNAYKIVKRWKEEQDGH